MKPLRIVGIFLIMQFMLQAQTIDKPGETFIKANADASDKATDHSILDFYTVDEFSIGNVIIPIHTRFSAMVRLYDGRAYLKVRSIKIGDDIYEIDWRAVGPDFKEGIPFIEEYRNFEVYEDQRLTFKAFYN
ncbi:MAG TPA: conjugative transposon protein TraM [Bacteroidia bacterium]|nr:conjugative transposon protein TraM [Bacteroidia bacterium]